MYFLCRQKVPKNSRPIVPFTQNIIFTKARQLGLSKLSNKLNWSVCYFFPALKQTSLVVVHIIFCSSLLKGRFSLLLGLILKKFSRCLVWSDYERSESERKSKQIENTTLLRAFYSPRLSFLGRLYNRNRLNINNKIKVCYVSSFFKITHQL